MAAAVCQFTCYNSTGPTANNADKNASGTSPKFGRDDTLVSTTPIPIPTATGTNYSWYKVYGLAVTTAGTTNITNRRISISAALATGLNMGWLAATTYAQAASTPTASGSNGTVLATYTAVTTTATQYDATSVATSATGINGKYVQAALGVDFTYAGGANSATTLPDVIITYDEA